MNVCAQASVVGLGHPVTCAKRAGSAKLVAALSAHVLVFCKTAVLMGSPSVERAWNFRCFGLSSVTLANACGPRSACIVVATWPKVSLTMRWARGVTASHGALSIGVGAATVPVPLEPGTPEPGSVAPGAVALDRPAASHGHPEARQHEALADSRLPRSVAGVHLRTSLRQASASPRVLSGVHRRGRWEPRP